jgi:hypothetical protein
MDPHLVTTPKELPQAKIAQVLFMDVVEYTKLKMRDQFGVSQQLTDIVRNTAEYRLKEGSDSVICRPVGDGMAVVFFADPSAPIRCAIEITSNVRRQPFIRLRMGIHSGPVFRHKDINQQPDVTGEGINIAQRVMDGGDANHILLSRAMADILIALGDWTDYISEIGLIEGKHGVRLFVYNFSSEEFGNTNPPTKRVSESKAKPLVRSAPASLSGDESKPAINNEAFGRQGKTLTRANDLPRTHLRNCGRCGMLLHRDSTSCLHCGY